MGQLFFFICRHCGDYRCSFLLFKVHQRPSQLAVIMPGLYIFFIRSGIEIIPSIVPSFSATNACAIAALLLFISVDTLMRHIRPVALQAACLSGEQGQQGERRPADDCSVLQSALPHFNHLPFFKLLLSWPRANRTRKLTTVSSICCHIFSPSDRRVINSAHHDAPYWLTVQIPWD